MPTPAGATDNKDQASPEGPTYDRSMKIEDVGGATKDNPKPQADFVDPNPGGMLGSEWAKRSR
jgi:hypothetical protein